MMQNFPRKVRTSNELDTSIHEADADKTNSPNALALQVFLNLHLALKKRCNGNKLPK